MEENKTLNEMNSEQPINTETPVLENPIADMAPVAETPAPVSAEVAPVAETPAHMGQEGDGVAARYPGSLVSPSEMKGSLVSQYPSSVSDGIPLPWVSMFISQNMGLLVKQA